MSDVTASPLGSLPGGPNLAAAMAELESLDREPHYQADPYAASEDGQRDRLDREIFGALVGV